MVLRNTIYIQLTLTTSIFTYFYVIAHLNMVRAHRGVSILWSQATHAGISTPVYPRRYRIMFSKSH